MQANATKVEGHGRMTPQDIRAGLVGAGVTQASLARRLGVSKAAVNRVIVGATVSDRIRAAVAEAIGSDPSEIWSGGTVAQMG